MKNNLLFITILIIILLMFTGGCTQESIANNPSQLEDSLKSEQMVDNISKSDNDYLADQVDKTIKAEDSYDYYFSPFTGRAIKEKKLDKAIMISVENSPQARPQSGLETASIVYEFLVEGGITRFLALYWDHIPDKIGPVRSVRPYIIETAQEYNSLLLHAGASPAGFAILQEGTINNLDQIYHGNYYWRSSDRRAPHNLYTGNLRIEPYLKKLTGQEYEQRFLFQRVSFINYNDSQVKKIKINYWGDNRVIYLFDSNSNCYKRYIKDQNHPHLTLKGEQLAAKNIIIQQVKTIVIDEEGRLEMELNGRGKANILRDGIKIDGFWENDDNDWTTFFDKHGREVELNPGQTWIEIVPESISIEFEE